MRRLWRVCGAMALVCGWLALCGCDDLDSRQQSAKDALTANAKIYGSGNDLATRAAKNFTPPVNVPTPTGAAVTAVGRVPDGVSPGSAPFACPDSHMVASPAANDARDAAHTFLSRLTGGDPGHARDTLSARLNTLLGSTSPATLLGTADAFTGFQSSQAAAADGKTACVSVVLSGPTFQPFNSMLYMARDPQNQFKVDYVRRL